MKIPLFKVYMAQSAHPALNSVLYSGYVGEGPQVEKFEQKISQFLERPHVAAVNSCTMGLTIALRIAQMHHEAYYGTKNRADEVISQPITCSATNMAIASLGLKIRWADTDPETCQMDPDTIPDVIGDKTLAVLPTHWGGVPGPSDEIIGHAEELGVPVIGDAAHAFGAQLDPREISVFSFQAIKHVTTGDGGAIALPKQWMLDDVRLLRWFGLDRTKGVDMRCKQDPPYWGFKGHMNDIAATIGLSNMDYLQARLDAAMENALLYHELLQGVADVKTVPIDRKAAFWLFTIFVPNRDGLQRKLNEAGVGATQVHRRNDTMSVFEEYRRELPGTDQAADTMLCLPVGWWVRRADVYRICDIIEKGW